MRRPWAQLAKYAIAVWFFTCFAIPVRAQTTPDVLAGITPYASLHAGEFDTINLSNGNVLIRIPIASFPQRGGALRLSFTFVDNSKIASTQTACSGGCYQWYAEPFGYIPPVFDKIVDDQAVAAVSQYYTLPKFNTRIYNWAIVGPDGALHPLGFNTGSNTYSLDSSGFYANPSGQDQATPPTITIDHHGIRYQPSASVYREDPNGNQITINSSNEEVDTMGRSVYASTSTTDYSGCTGPLPVASATINSFPGLDGGTMQFKFCYAAITVDIPGNGAPVKGNTFNTNLVQSIVLPNGTTWTLEYNDRNPGDPSNVNYGIPTKVTLPTGGTITYTYTTIQSAQASRWVTSRTVDANDGTGAHMWQYSYAGIGQGLPVTTVIDPLGNQTIHTFGQNQQFETLTQYYQLVAGVQTLLKTVQTDYKQLNNGNTLFQIVGVLPIRVTTTWPNGQVTKVETDYDIAKVGTASYSFGNVIARREYDYGSGAPGALLRTTTTAYKYASDSSYLTNNLLALPSSITVSGGSQTAYTTYNYDETSPGLKLSGLGVAQHLDTNPPDGIYRGNQTSVHRQLNNGSATATTNCAMSVSSGGYLVSYKIFYDTGTVYQSTDPCGSAAGDSKHTTSYAYSSTYVGAYLTKVTNPLGQSTNDAYDFNTGLLSSTEDPNLQTTSFTYDNMWRLASATYPDGGSSTITHQETATPFTATLTKKITSSQNYVTTNFFDGLGRVYQSQLTDPQGTIYTDTTYDADGRKASVSNPYRSKSESTYGVTSYIYDGLGRTCVVVPPDGTAVVGSACPTSQPSNDVFTTYAGNTTTVTDQQGKSRKSQTDGLGRLTYVWEDPAGLNYQTVYSYNALDDLLSAAQGGSRSRSFAFDSLKRLTSSTNPEAGTVTYTYDADSNVVTKKDARALTITYAYDYLNRMTGRTYSNGDPAVTYTYDQTTCVVVSTCFNIGRRTSMTDAGGSESWAYDKMGREWGEQRAIGNGLGAPFSKNTGYTYNLDGSLSTLTYPSGRTITYTPDSAGRPSEAQDKTNNVNYVEGNCANGVSSSGVCYAAQGAESSLVMGLTGTFTGITFSDTYNTRLQPNEIKAASTAGTAMDLSYNFVDTSSHNNGNVMGITNNVDTTRSQVFTYDKLNRLLTAETTSTFATSPSHCWGEAYVYDNNTTSAGEFGNLTNINVASSSYNGCTQESLSVTALSNNQLSATGFSYDASGNLLADGTNTYGFNAESEIKSAAGVNYTYDGDGNRLQKSNGKIYWYGAGTEILDESDASGNITDEYMFFGGKRIARRDSSGNIVYYVGDSLGTSRVVTSSTGTVLDQSDFYPYGGERVLASSSGNVYKFEGKERDTETTNDDFGARYYSSRFGRWLSPDWSSTPAPVPYANLTNPQTLNLYGMARDNPETFADLDGHDYLSAPQANGESISFAGDYAPPDPMGSPQSSLSGFAGVDNFADTYYAQEADRKAKEQARLSVGGVKVDITVSAVETTAGNRGVQIGANPEGCNDCSWAQTTTRTGTDAHSSKNDSSVPNQPLYPSTEHTNAFWDQPSRQKGGSGTFRATTTLGVADETSKTFRVLGSVTWGYNLDKSGNVRVITPRAATSVEQARSINVLRRDSPSWTITGP